MNLGMTRSIRLFKMWIALLVGVVIGFLICSNIIAVHAKPVDECEKFYQYAKDLDRRMLRDSDNITSYATMYLACREHSR